MLTETCVGQVLRDMRQLGVRFGFVTTYKHTVFLKIVFPSGGEPGVLCSEPISHTDRVLFKPGTPDLAQVSVRLGILYMLHRAGAADLGTWSFDPDSIPEADWTTVESKKGLGPETADYITPHKNDHTPLAQRHSNEIEDGETIDPFDLSELLTDIPDEDSSFALSDEDSGVDTSIPGPHTTRNAVSSLFSRTQPSNAPSMGSSNSGRQTRSMTDNEKRNRHQQ
jgi:hypothetical protein